MKTILSLLLVLTVGCSSVTVITEQHGIKETISIPDKDIIKIDTTCLPDSGGCLKNITYKRHK